MKSLKGASAREANRVFGRTGEPFWQKESYDHWVRNPSEFQKIRMYIEANPVKAGWCGIRRIVLGRAQASRRVSTRHAGVRA